MDAELTSQRVHAHALRAGCSHSVHFLVREPCSRSLLWFRRRADQRVIGLAVGLGIGADALVPRGNKPLDPWSPVPAALHCFHRQVRRREELLRIARLAIPPAWSDVEISRSPSAKVLARGRDAEGRTQRIYNPAFRRRQERRKFERLPRFGEALPALRAQVERDLSRRHLGRKRVTAGAVRLIDGELLRVGNARSAEQRGSYGATTLQHRHVLLTSRTVRLDFVGKSGQRHQHTVQDRRLARLLRRLAEGPGPELFRFEDEAGVTHPLRSSHINAYLARHLGEEFTAKDFRTWGGTVVAAATLLGTESGEFESPASRAAALRAAVSAAAEKLGNTVAVTRSSYVDPRVLKAVEHPAVLDEVRRARARMRDRRHFPVDEQATQALLAAMEHPRG